MTEQLPIPLSRADCYLATAAGMTGVILPANGPQSREEDYLAYMAGDTTIVLPTPGPIKEQWLAIICGDTSVTTPEIKGAFLIGQQMVRVEFLAKAAGVEGVVLPTNPNRTEQYFANIGGVVPDPGVLTQAKGTYIVLNNVLRGIDSLDYIYGDTYQQTYSGKNLFSGDNPLAVTGYMDITLDKQIDAGQYTISCSNITSTGTPVICLMGFVYTDNTTVLGGMNVTDKKITITATKTIAKLRIYANIDYASSQDMTTTFSDFQIEAGSTATSYESYVGGIPSPNPDYPQDIQVVTGEQTVNVHGKNILPITMTSQTLNGITYTVNDDKSITMSGKASSRSEPRLYQNVPGAPTVVLKAGVTYHNSTSTILYWYSNNYHTVVPGGNYTPVADEIIQFAFVRVENGETVDTTIYPQLEEGSTPTTYQPYQSQDYKVNLTSKNLLQYTLTSLKSINSNGTWTDNVYEYNGITYTVNADLTVNVDGVTVAGTPSYFILNNSLSLDSGTNYILNGCPSGGAPQSYSLRLYDSGNYTSDIGSGLSFTYGAQNMIRINIYAGITVTNKLFKPMVRLATVTDDSYQEYYNYELTKISGYQDYIYKSGDDWYVHKETNSYSPAIPNWIINDYTNVEYAAFSKPNDYVSYNTYVYTSLYCSHAIFQASSSGGWNSTNNIGKGFASANATYFWVGFTKGTGVDTIKTILNGMYIYYPLATPTDTKITDATLISELEAVGSAVLPTPDAFIQVTGNLAGEIEISYYAKSEE